MQKIIVLVMIGVLLAGVSPAQTPEEKIVALETRIAQLEQQMAAIQKQLEKLTPTPASKVEAASPSVPAAATGSALTQITGTGATLQVVEYRDAVKPENKYLSAKAGHKLVAVQVLFDNTAGQQAVSVNPLYMKLKDADGNQYTAALAPIVAPVLETSDVEIGDRMKGWVCFTVLDQADIQKMKLRYEAFSKKSGWINLADVRK